MGKKRQQYDGGHYSRRDYSKNDLYKGPEPGLDSRHALYESAVQSPKGDISYLLCFYQRYIGQQIPEHLQEDFCGTALLASTWCRGDVARRTAMGLDIDRNALMWGMQHNGEGLADTPQRCLWLLHGDVTQPLDKAVLMSSPVSSNSTDISNGTENGQPPVEQGMQDMNIQGTADAAIRNNCSSSILNTRRSAGQVPTAEPMQASKGHIHNDRHVQPERKQADQSSHTVEAGTSQNLSVADHAAQRQGNDRTDAAPESIGTVRHLGDRSAEACKAADIICAFNFSVCLLHQRTEVQAYFRQSRQALSKKGGILVMDLLGGHAAEESVLMHRHNDTTGARFIWEQENFNPVTRHIHCYITLRDPDTKKNLRRAFQYHWRLWTIPELQEMLTEAGFSRVHVWLRPMQGVSNGDEEEGDDAGPSETGEGEQDFEEYNVRAFPAKTAELLSKGWTAFVIGVALPA